jgi:hypothetical protein
MRVTSRVSEWGGRERPQAYKLLLSYQVNQTCTTEERAQMSDHEQFEHLFAAAASGSVRGKYWSQLSAENQTLITSFLSESKLSDKSKQSYKSYLSKAIVEPESLTRDQKSAIKLFETWLKK